MRLTLYLLVHMGILMRNCIILGSGRSGTSMVAGVLSNSGYFMGNDLYPPSESNPKGFFEAPQINEINEEIIELNSAKENKILKYLFRYSPVNGQRWLSVIDYRKKIISSPLIDEKITESLLYQPYCYKDPRFCYTLPIWRIKLTNTVFLCVFREPSITVNSILKECEVSVVLKGLNINYNIAMKVWLNMYSHILQNHVKSGRWLFIHYDQVLTDEGLARIEKFTGARIDRSFPDAKLKRTLPTAAVPKNAKLVYNKLCELADYI